MNADVARALELVLSHPIVAHAYQVRVDNPETCDDEDARFCQAVETLRAALEPAEPIRNPEPYKLGGVPLFEIAADIARTQARMITHEDRADGRVISPHTVRSNIHE